MKRIILSLATLLTITIATAQQPVPKTFPKTIQVTGTAEMEIAPDEIHVAVTLKEYEKKGKNKITIDAIRSSFLQNVRKAGIPDSAIKIISYAGTSGVHWWKKKPVDETMLASIVYEIIFSEPRQVEAFIGLLDEDATDNFAVTEVTHSKLNTMQQQLRMKATMAAKEKAGYLAAAVGEKIGAAITISETPVMEPFYMKTMAANTMNRFAENVGEAVPEFKKIKLRSEMNLVFELL